MSFSSSISLIIKPTFDNQANDGSNQYKLFILKQASKLIIINILQNYELISKILHKVNTTNWWTKFVKA